MKVFASGCYDMLADTSRSSRKPLPTANSTSASVPILRFMNLKPENPLTVSGNGCIWSSQLNMSETLG
jgi:hypothetical protein